jgi:anti-sigma factor NepR-like protein
VNRETNKKDRRQKMPGVNKKMDRAVEKRAAGKPGETQGAEADGLSPNLQAHIGRHVRAVFDEVAREPIPEHLLRLLNDLERSGDK